MTDLIKGIDVSAIQGNIDWNSVAASGIKFCIIRCGVGNGGIDGLYTKNVAGAQAAGLKVACYHFIYPLPTIPSQPLRDPVKQAQYHFNAAKGILACIDCEWPVPQDFAKWNCTPAQISQWMIDYLTEYERLDGRKPIIYTYPYWAHSLNLGLQFAQYPLWIASYEATPTIPKPWNNDQWILWQNSGGTQRLPNGVPVDGDYAKDLSLWNVVAPTPVVEPIPDHQPDPILTSPPLPSPVVPVVPLTSNTPGFFTSLWNTFFDWFKSH